ncbi:MAG: xylose isomerase [Planctomycetes bacterium RBG_16_59_8]|nr:MAG: xylose isomerase [Planctomycetes bacterium RBG_16_59_8]
MKLAFSTNAFRRYELGETISIIASAGYQGVEIMADRPHAWPPDLDEAKVDEIRESVRRNRLSISNINAFMMCVVGDFHRPSWIERDEKRRRMRIDHTIASLELAAKLGARRISTEPGGPLDGIDRREAMRLFQEGIHEAALVAARLGVKLLVEPEPDLLIERSDQFLEFMSGVKSDAVGLNFDVGHFFCVGEDPAELARRFGPLISHVHLEDIAADRKHFHLPPGKGAMDFDSLFNALREIGYDGWITVELYPFQEEAPRVAEEAFRFLQRYV